MLKLNAIKTTRLANNLLITACDKLFSLNKSSTKSADLSSNMSVEEEKQKYLNMPLEEKRSHYQINATMPDQIMSWYEYWQKNKGSIPKTAEEIIEKVDEALASKVAMWQGDITSLEIDAIVNAANTTLMGGGGVDGAIHKAAGPSLKKECATLNGCQAGNAKITGGYLLPAKYVIHTVGPKGEQPDQLQDCYENSLGRAMKHDIRTIAFPCISTGVYGYPQRQAAKIALSTVKRVLKENPDKIDKVIFCLFLKSDKDIYEDLFQKYFGLE